MEGNLVALFLVIIALNVYANPNSRPRQKILRDDSFSSANSLKTSSEGKLMEEDANQSVSDTVIQAEDTKKNSNSKVDNDGDQSNQEIIKDKAGSSESADDIENHGETNNGDIQNDESDKSKNFDDVNNEGELENIEQNDQQESSDMVDNCVTKKNTKTDEQLKPKYDNSRKERPLTVGDTLIAPEMLPITKKLIAKVQNKGEGKGIVSSAQSPEDLADKLFERFFLTDQRYVILKDYDITGLDALQALAMSGEVADLRSQFNPVTEPATYHVQAGKKLNLKPKMSKFKLLLKKPIRKRKVLFFKREGVRKGNKKRWRSVRLLKHYAGQNSKENKRFKQILLLSSSKNKAHVHQKPKNRFNKKINLTEAYANSHRKERRPRKTEKKNSVAGNVYKKALKKPTCHWSYKCRIPGDLDTCTLQTSCKTDGQYVDDKGDIDKLGLPHRPDEHQQYMKNFRRMIGLELIDEEVEKIIEARVQHLKPPIRSLYSQKVESLGEYFDKIVEAVHSGSTTPISIEKIKAVDSDDSEDSNRAGKLTSPHDSSNQEISDYDVMETTINRVSKENLTDISNESSDETPHINNGSVNETSRSEEPRRNKNSPTTLMPK